MELHEQQNALRDARSYLRWLKSFGTILVPGEQASAAAGEGQGSLSAQAPAKGRGKSVPRVPEPPPGSTTGSGGGPLSGKGTKEERLARLQEMVASCTRCRLCETAKHGIFGEGDWSADLMFIGEAPGATEDKVGRPFVGRAGQVLTGELEKNGIKREEVFITNLVKHRPPENRDPLADEIEACAPYLHEQIDLIKPKMLCGLGRFACTALIGAPIKIMQIRGTWAEYRGIPLFICLHPSAVLHQQANRHLFDEDIAKLAEAYRKARE